ncbi:MAG: glycosyltransferase family 4 protein [Candidatus Helarchaeota archaeon]
MNLLLIYYKQKELHYILKEKRDGDNIFIYNGRKYIQLVKRYSRFPNKIRLWYAIEKLLKKTHLVDLSMMDVNLYYPYLNIHQLIFPKTPLIWRMTGNIFMENLTQIGHPLSGDENYRSGGKLFLSLSRNLLDRCSAVITTSNWLKNELHRVLKQRNILVIYKNVDTKIFNPKINGDTIRKTLGITEDQILLLSVMQGSFFQKIKGLFYYLNVIKRLNTKFGKKIVCIICGDGYYYQYLKEYTAKLNLNNLHFLGFKSKINEIYAASDIFVHPSLLDAAPQVIREAGMLKKPIVAFKTGGIPEIIDDRHGFLIDPHDLKTFYSNLLNLIESKTLRHEYGEKAYLFIRKKNRISSGRLFWKIFDKFKR